MSRLRDARPRDLEQINLILDTNGQIADVTPSDIKDFVVIEEDGRVVGCGMLKEHANSVEMSKISVLPNYQRRGLGMEIAMTLMGRARGRQCWLLSVNSHNFWELFGFRKVAEEDEPSKVRAQCLNCSKRPKCNRVVMVRERE